MTRLVSSLPVTGVVLAGGRSTRFGENKVFASLGGRTLLEIAVAKVAGLCDDRVVVAPFGASEDEYRVGDVRVARDPVAGQGPLVGLVAGLAAARRDRALVVAVDLPCMQEAVLRLLLAEIGTDVVLPVVGGRLEPLHAVYACTARDTLAAAVARGIRKVTDGLEGLSVRRIEEARLREVDPELRSFWNVNRPDDLDRIATEMNAR